MRDDDGLAFVSARLRKNRLRRPWKQGEPVIIYFRPDTNSVQLSWTGSPLTTLYLVSRDGVSLGTTETPLFNDTGLEPETSYQYEVSASHLNKYFSPSVKITASTVSLPIPQWHAPTTTPTSITLSWTPLGPEYEYILYRGGTAVEVAHTLDTVYTVINLNSSTEYTYDIRSVQSCGCTVARSRRNAISVTTSAAPAPSSLQLKPVGKDTLLAFWDIVPGASSYILERDGVEIFSGIDPVYSDTGLAVDTAYSYRVRSQSNDSVSPPSESLTGKTNAQQMILNWDDKPDDYVLGQYPWIQGTAKNNVGGIFTTSQNAYESAVDINSQQGFSFSGGGARWRIDVAETSVYSGFRALTTAFPALKVARYSHSSTGNHYVSAVGRKRFTLKSIKIHPGIHDGAFSIWPMRDSEILTSFTTPIKRTQSPNPLTVLPNTFINITGFGLRGTGTWTRVGSYWGNDQGWPKAYWDIEIEWH